MNRFKIGAARRMPRRLAALVALLVMALSLSGCLYPEDQKKQNQVASKEAVRNVQAAIDQYQSDTGMLPIKNSASETPIYEKFNVDFAKLQRMGYLSEAPSAAFEKGGNFYFLIIDEETKPRIRLMDIVTFQRINDIQSWVTAYVQSKGNLPKGEEMYPGYYQLDYKSMSRTEPTIRSMFSGQSLQALVDDNGVVYCDYGIDIMQLVQKSGKTDLDTDLDLRTLLVDGSDYVPVKAPVYHWVNNEPQAVK
ncbi:hypothetical protein FHS15_002712 [Paenibacillus castaneae]|uniref:DUF3939 domain-containing protein n=1 Tax=Paenibacillus castaneae TaxID=474957 RepID=UPI000C9BBBC8|nr:DUF3939 domain-containing protein [Paenibacillus castaneae]NIK77576.1 hypothetical protein [Paenibacillus castaneae]